MESELLLALLGCPGDLIRPGPAAIDPDALGGSGPGGGRPGAVLAPPPYEVDPKLPFLTAAEKEAINRVASLGSSYAEVAAFIDERDTEFTAAAKQKQVSPAGRWTVTTPCHGRVRPRRGRRCVGRHERSQRRRECS